MEFSVVVLGDAGVGKSDLLTRLTSRDAPTVEYHPTVGADMKSTTITWQPPVNTHSESVDSTIPTAISNNNQHECHVTFWEFPGNERFLAPYNSQLIKADLCILMCDVCVPDTLAHLDTWHDEFLQSHFSGAAPAAFVVVANKCDISEHRSLSQDPIAGWCGKERIDPGLWLKDVAGDNCLPTPPYVEVSARTGAGIDILKNVIVQRCHSRTIMNRVLPTRLPAVEAELAEHDSISKGAVRCIMFGESDQAKDALLFREEAITSTASVLPPIEVTERSTANFHAMQHANMRFAIWNAPNTQTTSPMWFCRGSHMCIMTLQLGIQAMTHRLQLWKEIFFRESSLRDASGVLWIVVGRRTASYIPQVSAEVNDYCLRNGYQFIDIPEETNADFILGCWDRIADLAETHRRNIIIERTEEQVQNLISVCPNETRGCRWRGKAGEAVAHYEQLCPLTRVQCRFDCGADVGRGERETHEKFCNKRPPTCHFCDLPYATTLVEHLQFCTQREAFENAHVRCPLADFGCQVQYVKRSEVAEHLQGDAPRHMELLSNGLQHVRTNTLTLERNQTLALTKAQEQHQVEVKRLEDQLADTQDELNGAKNTIKDMKLEMTLLWQEIEALKRRNPEHL